jgi:hypothetical protein
MDRQVKIKVWHLLVVLALVFFAAGIGGESIGADLAQDEIDRQKQIIKYLELDNERLQKVIEATEDATANDKQEIKTLENEYRYERSLRLRLQRENTSLKDSIFGYSRLDSLAEYYRFEKH